MTSEVFRPQLAALFGDGIDDLPISYYKESREEGFVEFRLSDEFVTVPYVHFDDLQRVAEILGTNRISVTTRRAAREATPPMPAEIYVAAYGVRFPEAL